MIELRRIDPARNMRRFYRLDTQPDLFGGFLLMKQWGRIGTSGRITAERFETPGLAAVALAKQARRKERRSYTARCPTS
jgi:predicted DNA-binding WGR domain protein